MWPHGIHLMNSVYGFKDDASSLDDDEGDKVNETVQKDHRTLNRLNLRRKLKTTLLI